MVNIPLNLNDHGGIGEFRDAQTCLFPKNRWSDNLPGCVNAQFTHYILVNLD